MNDDGLEGVVAAHTVLSEVDGAAGRLVIRGHTLDEIARSWQFEDVAGLLWECAPPRLSSDEAEARAGPPA
ncbi:citrate/2-methylcitrate synthase, partial [Variovorax sp. CT11-76]